MDPGGTPLDQARAVRAGQAARALGVALPTLRAWDHRYGVGPRGRTSGGHRLYGPADLARLRLMCELVRQGVPASDAAERVLLPAGRRPVRPR